MRSLHTRRAISAVCIVCVCVHSLYGRFSCGHCLCVCVHSLYGLVHEGFQWCNASVSNLSCEAAAPLHKLDIVQVVLNAPQVGKSKGDKSSMTCPIEVFLLLNDL